MSNIIDAIRWFKGQFAPRIASAIEGTPVTADLVTAIAMQETYYIWGDLYRTLPVDEVLALCVGDTLDFPKRRAFPRTKAELFARKDGAQMFAIARQALEDIGHHFARYDEVARMNPNKFCHGFGIFQYDLQHFTTNPRFFLDQQWQSFDICLSMCVSQLRVALKAAYGSKKKTLTDEEQVYVAIAYNSGSVDFSRKFRQGYRDDSGKYYGEHMRAYLQLARSAIHA